MGPGSLEICGLHITPFDADGCPVADDCPFYAPRIYAGPDGSWPRAVISEIDSVAARMEALRTGPYGRCVR